MDLDTVDELLTTTRMVRKRLDLDRPVPSSVIVECLRLAAQAPIGAGGGGQLDRWRWIVVTDPTTRAQLADLYRAGGLAGAEALSGGAPESLPLPPRTMESALHLAEHLQEVPVLVVPCVEKYPGNTGSDRWGSYIYPAVWSFILALRSRGLGSCLTTMHLERENEVAALLNVPDGFVQACLLPVAYYTGTTFQPAKRQPIEQLTYWDRWNQTRPSH